MSNSVESPDEFRRELKKILSDVLDERRKISEAQHAADHDYIRHLMEQDKVKQERREKISVQVWGWGIISALGGIGIGLWYMLKEAIVNLLRHITSGG